MSANRDHMTSAPTFEETRCRSNQILLRFELPSHPSASTWTTKRSFRVHWLYFWVNRPLNGESKRLRVRPLLLKLSSGVPKMEGVVVTRAEPAPPTPPIRNLAPHPLSRRCYKPQLLLDAFLPPTRLYHWSLHCKSLR